MSKLAVLFAFVLFTFSITKCSKQETITETNTKEIPTKQDSDGETEAPDDQGDMKSRDVDLMASMTECNDSFRIEISFIQALNESGSFPDETDKTPKCFLRCVLENTRVASTEGEYDPEQAAKVLSQMRVGKEAEIENGANICSKRDESCKCERAYQFMKCLLEREIQKNEKSYQ